MVSINGKILHKLMERVHVDIALQETNAINEAASLAFVLLQGLHLGKPRIDGVGANADITIWL